jgi:hypothetical protein
VAGLHMLNPRGSARGGALLQIGEGPPERGAHTTEENSR